MSTYQKPCQGQFSSLESSSKAYSFNPLLRKLLWGIRNKGFSWTLRIVLSKIMKPVRKETKDSQGCQEGQEQPPCEDVLNLQPGETVEVKPEREILATLDAEGKHQGLLWMRGMGRYCGRRYKVLKKVKTIRLESSGRLRRMKNTVLLSDVMCDGSEYYGCDRSCFHFWREVWLRRVVEQ